MLLATGAAAESMLEVLVGDWALMAGSQAATDAENVANASKICAGGNQSSDIIAFEMGGTGLILTAIDGADEEVTYAFDESVRGGMLRDGRLALNFFAEGERSHEMIYWGVTIDGTERDLLEVQGPPNPAGLYMKCPL